jgi:predicted ester cyclase
VNIAPGLPPRRGRAGARQLRTSFRTAFPQDSSVTVHRMIAEGDTVAAHFTFGGTHAGEFMGIPSTGKRVEVTGAGMFRLANGQRVENRVPPDTLSMLQQLGAIPRRGPEVVAGHGAIPVADRPVGAPPGPIGETSARCPCGGAGRLLGEEALECRDRALDDDSRRDTLPRRMLTKGRGEVFGDAPSSASVLLVPYSARRVYREATEGGNRMPDAALLPAALDSAILGRIVVPLQILAANRSCNQGVSAGSPTTNCRFCGREGEPDSLQDSGSLIPRQAHRPESRTSNFHVSGTEHVQPHLV